MIGNNAARLLRPITRNVIQKRTYEAGSVVAGPPTVHVSTIEKTALGLAMVASWIAIPTFILVNIKHYRQSN